MRIAIAILLGSVLGAAQTLTISAPADGTAVRWGEAATFAVQTTGEFPDGIVLLTPSRMPPGTSDMTAPYSFTITIPQVAPGMYEFRALGLSRTIGPVRSNAVRLLVDAPAPLGEIGVVPSRLTFAFDGEQAGLTVTGKTTDGSVLYLSGSPRLTFISSNPLVAAVSTDGRVTARQSGSTNILVRYAGVEIAVPVSTRAGVVGDLDGDNDVDFADLEQLTLALGTTGVSATDARDLNRDGRIDDRDATALLQLAGACTFAVARSSMSLSALGDLVPLRVVTQPACSWKAEPGAPWITATPFTLRPGSGVARFEASTGSSNSRTTSTRVAGQTLSIFQAGAGCSFALTSGQTAIPPGGGAFTIGLSTAADCDWTAAPAGSWLTIAAPSGRGSGEVRFVASANNLPIPRTGTVTVGGQTLQLTQQRSASPTPQSLFADVPVTHPFSDHITLLRGASVTSGCTATTYCPDATTTRGQMAVFIVRALHEGDTFFAPAEPYFSDVPRTHPFFRHIQKLRELGVTSGCTPTTYCPDDPVTRGQMAVFLVRAAFGIAPGDPFPFPPAAWFADVAPSHPFFSFIQKMRQIGITSGCTANNYCVDDPTTRGQMAVFLVRAFFTP